jgi:hypothetical protein
MPRFRIRIAALLLLAGGTAWALTGNPLRHRDRGLDAGQLTRIDGLRADILALQALGNRTTFDKQWEAARWVGARLESLGLRATIDTYERDAKSWPNVVARQEGGGDEEVLVISHLDSISRDSTEAPGADDNASGVAAMLQVARDLAGARLDRSVVFASFSNEERGLGGSTSYATRSKQQGDHIVAVVNLDILGYNRPALLDAAWPHGTLKYRAKGAWRGVRNYAIGLVEGDDVLLVAGREPNRRLAETVAAALRTVPGVNVKLRVDDDCG